MEKSPFSKRKCAHCGIRFDPAARSANPANAARMLYCCRACKNAAWRDAHRDAVQASNRRTAAAWYAHLDPSAKSARIAKISERRKKNAAQE